MLARKAPRGFEMAIVASYEQQPADYLDYALDYDEFLPADDAPMSCTVAVAPVGLTVSSPVVTGRQVKYWVSGGASGIKYKVTLTMTSVLGRIKQDEVRFSIKDR